MITQLLLVGVIAGIIGGMYGGGGFVIVPAMTFLVGISQKSATGLSLGVQLFSILGAVVYYREGYLSIKYAIFVAVGMILGNFLGASLATQSFVSDTFIKKTYGLFLLFAAVKYLFLRS
ncbi:TSUP family transporter [Pelatocladus sp. BLCC-F211]|uniref:TSUP family transporter n=1 Tax=Pelatocladus sp. BLCC-F211 TaxID=3342752 RepID=UPI0035B8B540